MCAANNASQHNTTKVFGKNASLKVSSNNKVNIDEHPLVNLQTSIGRDPRCDICITEDLVSGYHFQIEQRNGLYYLVHPHPQRQQMGTANGFSYQGRQYQGTEQFTRLLQHGDVFRIGEPGGAMVSIAFDDGSGNVQDTLPQIRDVYLRGKTLTLGRAPDNDVQLNHETVSSHHARLEKAGTGYRILDRGSTNHVYINGGHQTDYYLTPGDEIEIGPFKLVYNGTILRCDENRSIRIAAHDLCKVVANKRDKKSSFKEKALLKDISLVIPPHSFVALVGSSGAGKSTLLKALNGLSPTSGTVYYNGQDYYKSYATFSTQLGYVPQDDIVHRELTVQSALSYGAKLRLPSDYTEAQIDARIKEVLQEVEMSGMQGAFISTLSGGQRKRVSIALELLANPSVFFLDEPTSGLDPGLDRKMMNLLRKLADKGKTIVLVTHATNNINVCDYVCFMGAGQLVYFGPPSQTMQFFKKTDFADIYNELENEQKCQQWSADFRNSPDYKMYVSDPLQATKSVQSQNKQARLKRAKRSRPLSQWILLCKRYLELLKNDRWNLGILLLQAPVIAFIVFAFIKVGVGPGGFATNKVVQCPATAQMFTKVGLPDVPSPSSPAVSKDCNQLENKLQTTQAGRAYVIRHGSVSLALQDFIVPGPGDAPMILFIMAFAAVMCGCINSLREIVKEDPIYRRERAVNVGILPYLFSKITILGALCLLQSAALVGIICLVDPFPHGTFLPGWLEIYITIALTALAGLMFGLAISALVPNSDRALSFLPLFLLPQVVFSGTLFPLGNSVLQIIGMAFPARWAMAALGSTVGIHSDKVFGPGQSGDKLFGNNYSYHGTLFSTYSLSDATWHLLDIWLALGIMSVVLILVAGLCLRVKDRRSFGHIRRRCINCKRKLLHPNALKCKACGAQQYE